MWKDRGTGGVKALLTSGALAAILWLWAMLAGSERPPEEKVEAALDPFPTSSATLKLEPLPTLVPTPDGRLEAAKALRQPNPGPAPTLRSVQVPPPPRVIRVPPPSGSKPAAVTRSSR
ncbi:hypothetical protein [Thermoflexus sp.]|uniref:hypothetical protein n=1 Tax=Thermoflexus sp. TaxID=1969742 RepID=UPI0035E40E80